MRRWHYHAVTNQPHSVIVTPIARADRGRRRRQLHHRTFTSAARSTLEGAVPRLGADVPRWYGETIGFLGRRRADHLDVEHPGLEGRTATRSSRTSCRPSRSTRRAATPPVTFLGLNHEGIFYDPEALVEPIRMIRHLERVERLRGGRPVHLHRVRADDLSRSTAARRRCRPATVIGTRCPTCSAGRGRSSGRSTTRRA